MPPQQQISTFSCCKNFQYPVSNVKIGIDIYIYIHNETSYGTKTRKVLLPRVPDHQADAEDRIIFFSL